MTKRTLSLLTFGLLGALTVVALLIGWNTAASVLLAVMATAGLALLTLLYSQLRSEGATQRAKLSALRTLVDGRFDDLRTELSAENHEFYRLVNRDSAKMSKRVATVAADNAAALVKLNAHSVVLDGLHTAVDSGVAELLQAIALTAKRQTAWNDALRDTLEDVDVAVTDVAHRAERIDTVLSEVAMTGRSVAEDMSHLHRGLNSRLSEIISELADSRETISERYQAVDASLRRLGDDHIERFAEIAETVAVSANLSDKRFATLTEQFRTDRDGLREVVSSEIADIRRAYGESVEEFGRTLVDQPSAPEKRFRSAEGSLTRLPSEAEERFGHTATAADVAQQDFVQAELETLKTAVADGFKTVRAQQLKETTKLNVAMYSETQQTEALLQLIPMLEPRWLMPALGRWALDARAMLHVYQLIMDDRPKRILELGSGTSTIWLGYIAEKIGATVMSVDHDLKFKERTDYFVSKHGLEDVVTTMLAPLQPVELDNKSYQWYSLDAFDEVNDIDLLLIDGPIGSTVEWVRYPAVPVLWNRLSQGGLILLDDAERQKEAESVASWIESYPLVRMHEGASRLAVLRVNDDLRDAP